MARKVRSVVRLQIQAGKATPAPPVGTALGPHGVNIMGFVKEYNARTADQTGNIIPVDITIYEDRSSHSSRRPACSAYFARRRNRKGSSESDGTCRDGHRDQVREIAQLKLKLNTDTLKLRCRLVWAPPGRGTTIRD